LGILAIAMALVIGAFGALRASGLCLSEYRWLGDDEIVRAAVKSQAFLIKQLQRNVVRSRQMPRGWRGDDADVEIYIKGHPDCCAIMGERRLVDGQPIELFSRALGDRWVRFRFDLSDEGARRDSRFYEIDIRVSPCGEVREERGMRTYAILESMLKFGACAMQKSRHTPKEALG
jgi:hypothetical protein